MNWMVFHCPTYYPRGGMDDLIGNFSTQEEAEKFADKYREEHGLMDYAHEVSVLDFDNFIANFKNKEVKDFDC